MGDITYVNGRLVQSQEAVVSAGDAGFLYGDGLFETMRTYSGRVFMLQAHLKRLEQGASMLEIKAVPPVGELEKAIKATLLANGAVETVVRVTVTRGTPEGKSPTVVIQTRPIPYHAEDYETGASCLTLPDLRAGISDIKSLNYLPNLMARREAGRNGCLEAILIDKRDLVTEGTASNVFIVSGDELRTPPLNGAILPGVTRGIVMGIAKEAGLRLSEEEIRLPALIDADEVFITNSIMGIMPVTNIDKTSVGSGRPGKETKSLTAKYQKLAKENPLV